MRFRDTQSFLECGGGFVLNKIEGLPLSLRILTYDVRVRHIPGL